ncbi:MAG: hypothetical protein EOO46_15615 [Flavobacterium sp.]|nr:MAG: hypothetical protein EOO46_15615 [Flavobacterium sp.]
MELIENHIKIFGAKEVFAIEIKPYKIPKKFYLRLWFDNHSIGDFKKAGSLDYIINTYFKLERNINYISDSPFKEMTDMEVFNELVMIVQRELPIEEENALVERMNKYAAVFGVEQFLDFTFLIMKSCAEENLKFLIYEMDGNDDPKLYSYKIKNSYFFNVYKQFILYAFQNDFKKRKPFFPEGFSYSDFTSVREK